MLKGGTINSLTNQVNKINNSNNKLDNKTIDKLNNKINNINKNNNSNIPKIRNRNIHINKKDLFKPIGILDPKGENNNPLTGEPYKNLYQDSNGKSYVDFAKMWSELPIYKRIKELIQVIYDNQIILVVSGTGSGKSLVSGKAVLHTMNYQGRIVLTNPKKIPSEDNAFFNAKTLDVKVGDQVGIKYRGSDPKLYSKDNTKLLYATDGYVLAKLMSDPLLEDYDCVVLDEVQNRSVNLDLLMLFLKQLTQKRKDFKLVLMSATINEQIFINYFSSNKTKFAIFQAEGKPNYPVKEIFLKKPVNKFDNNGVLIQTEPYIQEMVKIIINILKNNKDGDILGFVTGKGEADEVCQLLHQKLNEINKNTNKKLYCTILTGSSDNETKEYATKANLYKTHPRGPFERKVVIGTEVLEASITIANIKFVVESGLVNNSKFYSDKDVNALEKIYVSKASHMQRKGRTGRVEPGECYNLFTENEYKNFLDYQISPIKQDDISEDILVFLSRTDLVSHIDLPFQFKKNAVRNKSYPMSLSNFMSELIELPHEDYVKDALKKLYALGAIRTDGNKAYITELGKAMSKFNGTPIEIAKMIISSYNYKCSDEICKIAGLLEVADYRFDNIFERFKAPKGNKSEIDKAKKEFDSRRKKWIDQDGDLFSLFKAYLKFSTEKNKNIGAREWCKKETINYNKMDRVKYTSKDFIRKLYSIAKEERDKSNVKGRDFILFPESYPNLELSQTVKTYNNGGTRNILDVDKNIQKAILDGFFINLIRNTGKTYLTCFPRIQTQAQLSRESLFGKVKKKTNYAYYVDYKSIFGNPSFEIVGRIPLSYLEEAKKDPLKSVIIEACSKIPKRENNRKEFKKGMKKMKSKSRSKKGRKGKSKRKY